MRRARAGGLLALLLTVCTPSLALELELKGTHTARGAFTSTITLTHDGRKQHVVREVRWADGTCETASGTGRWVGQTLRATLKPKSGMVGRLEGKKVRRISLKLQSEVRDGATQWTSRTRDREGSSLARTDGHPNRDEAQPKLAGRILAVTRKGLESDPRVEAWIPASEALHVGVVTGVHLLNDGDLSPEQRATLAGREQRSAWLTTEVGGGIRFPFTADVPVGPASVGVGFVPGGTLTYAVTDVYDAPSGLNDVRTIARDHLQVAKHLFSLPLSEAEARAMNVGAERVMRGQFTLALKGHVAFGYEVGHDGGVLQVGARAEAGGFYQVTSHHELSITRLQGSELRVRVRSGRAHAVGAQAKLVVRAALNREVVDDALRPEKRYLRPLYDVNSWGAALAAQHALKIELSGEAGASQGRELDLRYRFDLDRPAARDAYLLAVRGDLVSAGELALQPGSGVVEEFRIVDLERRTHRAGRVSFGLLASSGSARSVSVKEILVDGPRTTVRYEVFRFERERTTRAVGKRWERRLFIEMIRADDGSAAPERWFTYRYTVRDPSTRLREAKLMQRILSTFGANRAAKDLEADLDRKRLGLSTAKLRLRLSERGLRRVLSASWREAYDAYADSETRIRDRKRHAPATQRRARRFADTLTRLADATSGADRAQALRKLTGGTAWDLYTAAAVRALAPAGTVHLQAEVEGKHMGAEQTVDGEGVEERPELHGH